MSKDVDKEVDVNMDARRGDLEPEDLDLPYTCSVCGKSFKTFKAIQGHSLGAHGTALRRDDLAGEGGLPRAHARASSQLENPLTDLTSDIPMLKDAVTVSRWKMRLKVQDPAMYRLLFPGEVSGEAQGSVSSKLLDLEMANYVRSLTEKTEASHQPILPLYPQIAEGQYEEVTEYIDKHGNLCGDPEKAFSLRSIRRPIASAPRESADVRELKEEVKALSQKLEDEKFSSLKTSFDIGLTSLRNEIKSNSSELRVLIESATDLAKTWISSPGPITQMAGSRLGFDVVTETIPQSSKPEASQDVVSELRKHGFTGTVIEREKP